jgi:ABC-2 type transport system ATP-binding protein
MIKIENVTKRYGSFCAVNDISLEVKEGEIFGFLGVNGAGKTTTLRMVTGILRPTSGKIVIGEYDLAEQPEKAKLITGYIPDRPYLYNKLTGREFLYFVADLYMVPAEQSEERIDKLLKDYGLSQWQDEMVENYSHGMKQRLATCAALVHKPKVLVVDEPMVGLDPHGAKLLKDRFRSYAEEGMSILLSTHSLNVAEEVADRLAIINQGKILTTGTLEEIRALTGSREEGLEEMFLQLTAGFSDY